MAGYVGTKAVLLSTTAANVGGDADIGGDLTVDTNTLYVDSTNNRVGVGNASPTQALDVTGDIITSGGVYLGGTGSANKLDDYEEGTFTPTVSWQSGSPSYSASGRYTKVGNIVSVRASISVTSSGGSGIVIIENLPFVPHSVTQSGSGAERGNTGKALVVWVGPTSTTLALRYYDYSDAGTTSGDTLIVNATYEVS